MKKVFSQIRNGFVEAELLLAIAILGILVTSVGGGLIYATQSLGIAESRERAIYLAEEGIEAVRAIRDNAWNELEYTQSGVSGLSGGWEFLGESTSETLGDFTRTITFSDVCRTTAGVIATCPGDYIDVESKFINVDISFTTILGVAQTVSRDGLLTNWRGTEFVQSDWSGGAGQTIFVNEDEYDSDDGNADIGTAGQLTIASSAACTGYTWDFTSASNYNYNPFEIGVSGGFAQLQQESGDWWDGAYGSRSQVSVTTGVNTPENGYDGYTVRYDGFDTATLVGAGSMQSDCSDLRVVFFNGSTNMEIDRDVIDCNTSSTAVHFALQQDMSASTTETYYAFYYDSASPAVELDNLSNVYLWFDDASSDGSAGYINGRGDVWHETGGSTSFSWNGAGYYTMDTGDDSNESVRIPLASMNERDAYIEMETFHTDAYPNDMTTGLVGRYIAASGAGTVAEAADHYYSPTRADSSFQGGSYATDRSIIKTDRTTVAVAGTPGGPIAGNQWRRSGFSIHGASPSNLQYWDNDTATSLGDRAFPSSAVITSGTDSEYETAGEWGIIAAQDQFRFRNILARRYTNPEPVLVLAAAEVLGGGASITLNTTQIDTFEHEASVGTFPKMIQISTNIYAVVSRGTGNDGFVKTINLADDGTIGAVIDTHEFDTSEASYPDIVNISGDVYGIAYQGNRSDGFLATVSIDSAGQIGNSNLDSLEFDTSDGVEPKIIQISSGIVAIAYQGNRSDGFVNTYAVSPLGIITTAPISSFEHDATEGTNHDIINVSGDVYAIAYTGSGSDGFIRTITINTLGVITLAEIDSLEFDAAQGLEPEIINIAGDVFAIIYDGNGGDGFIKTLNISTSGTIGLVIDTVEYDISDGSNPEIIPLSGSLYLSVNQGSGSDGFVYLHDIASNGIITTSPLDSFEYNVSQALNPSVILIDSDTYAITYSDSASDGFIDTYDLTTSVGYIAGDPSIEALTTYAPASVELWTGFTEVATKNGGEIYYQISDDNGASWQFHNGTSWTTVVGPTDYNTASEVDALITTFDTAGSSLTFKAFLEGDGSQFVQLDSVEVICGQFQMEVGTVSTDENWITVNLSNTYNNPVVTALGSHLTNTESSSVRVRNVAATSFDVRLHNPSNANLSADDIDYMVVEAGIWESGGLKLEAKNTVISAVGSANNGWTGEVQPFTQTFLADPVVLHQVVTENDSGWITSFIDSSGITIGPPDTVDFELGLNAAEVASSDTHAAETIAWIAIEPTGTAQINGVDIEAQSTGDSIQGVDDSCNATTHQGTYLSLPFVIGAQSEVGVAASDGSWAALCSETLTDVGFYAVEDQVGDTERRHANETFGYVAFSDALIVTASGGGGGGGTTTVLTSSAFDMGANSTVAFIDWTEDLSACPGTCLVEFEVRAAPDSTGSPGTWSAWFGATGGGTVFSAAQGTVISKVLNENQWIQYRVTLTGDGANNPILEEVRINYR